MYNLIAVAALSFAVVFYVTRERYSSFVSLALGFAQCAHKDQVRKYTFTPYISHCLEVLQTLDELNFPDHVLAAAVLHDTIEDTTVTYADIVTLFGPKTAVLVAEVTDVSKPTDGNRATRKALDAAHLSKSSYNGASIKLADLISNTASITRYDPNFARLYLREKMALLPLLRHGHPGLHARATSQVYQAWTGSRDSV